ncbi:hypothetical protein [Nocardioides insulae]|uniref:hypothetical protein n=1 Tax=Nocardioides insulae TaxID=394734 RepID=UPI0012F7240D|nr:hypothetical protein [Nocardioides insulae]
MPSYAVDSIRQPFTGTGIVEPVMEWVETPEGRRRPGDVQARSEDTGMPLWAVEVLYVQSSFGRRSTVTAKVTVGHEEEPRVAPLTPIGFTGLRVEVRTNKAGGFAEYWSAEGLMETSKSTGSGSQAGNTGSTSGGGRSTGGEKAA